MVVGKIAIAIAAIVFASLAAATTVVLSLISIYIPNQSSAASGMSVESTFNNEFAYNITNV